MFIFMIIIIFVYNIQLEERQFMLHYNSTTIGIQRNDEELY
jgi:hypothetical protein